MESNYNSRFYPHNYVAPRTGRPRGKLDNSTFLKTETGIKTNDRICFYRKLLRNYLLETYVNYFSKQIGGNGNVFQIDETVIVKRKYHHEKELSKKTNGLSEVLMWLQKRPSCAWLKKEIPRP